MSDGHPNRGAPGRSQHTWHLAVHEVSPHVTIQQSWQTSGASLNDRPLILERTRPGGRWSTNAPVFEMVDPVLKVTESRQWKVKSMPSLVTLQVTSATI
jgi:hypothetical protein